MYQCDYCNYESIYKYNVTRHEEGKHQMKIFNRFIKTLINNTDHGNHN